MTATNPNAERSPWLTVPEACQRAKRAKATILAALAEDSLRGHRPGEKGRWRIHVDDLDAWVRGEKAPVRIHSRRRSA